MPGRRIKNVFLKELIANERFNNKEIKLPIVLEERISAVQIFGDLSAMPNLLIAGTTGSGNSVCLNGLNYLCFTGILLKNVILF